MQVLKSVTQKPWHDLKKNDIAHTTFLHKYTNKESWGLALCRVWASHKKTLVMLSSPGRQPGFRLMSQILSLSKLDLSMGETWLWYRWVKKNCEGLTRLDWDQALQIPAQRFGPRNLHLIWQCIFWQVQTHTWCNSMGEDMEPLRYQFPLWPGFSQASRAFPNIIGLFDKGITSTFVYTLVEAWMLNSHKPYLAVQPKEEVPPHLAVEWMCQVAVQPFQNTIFCLPRRSFNSPMNHLKLWFGRSRGYSKLWKFFQKSKSWSLLEISTLRWLMNVLLMQMTAAWVTLFC